MNRDELVSGLREGLQTKSYMNDATMPITSMVEYIDKNIHDYGRDIRAQFNAVSKVGGNALSLAELVAWCDYHLNVTVPNIIRQEAARAPRHYSLIRHKETGAVYAWRAGERPIFYHVKSNDELHFLASSGLSGGWEQVVEAETNLVEFLHRELARFASDKSQMEEIQAAPPPKTHTVVKGDTLGKIAAAYGVTVADLVAWNGLASPDNIEVGQVLKLEAP